jgi:endogenous inhibitor of DNA gyrase (YacG/DUF329 family)
MKKGGGNMAFIAKEIDEELMVRLYDKDNKPSTEIAKILGVTTPTVLRRLKLLGVTIKPKHGNPCNKLRLKDSDIPYFISDVKIRKQSCTGVVLCPTCGKSRRLYLNRKRIEDIRNSNCRCSICITKARKIIVNEPKILALYKYELKTIVEISKIMNVNKRKIRSVIENTCGFLDRGKLKKLRYKYFLLKHNKGTITNPVLGDIRGGIELGYNHNSYYIYTKCKRCGKNRWEAKSKEHKYPYCKPCKMELNGLYHSGENAVAWLGGISFEPYSAEFNKPLKEYIKERDNYICQVCRITNKALSVHHIDYNKTNCDESNLISLCSNCHSKTNHNREYWTNYLKELMTSRYNYNLSSTNI